MQGIPIDILPFATCVMDTKGVIRGVNEKFSRLLGYGDPEIFTGLPIGELVVEKSRQSIHHHMQLGIEKGNADSAPQLIYLLNTNGDQVKAYCTVSYRSSYDRVLLHVMSEIDLEEDRLAKHLKWWFVETVLHTNDTRDIFTSLIEQLTEASGLECGAVFIRESVNEVPELFTSYGLSSEIEEVLNRETVSQWGSLDRVIFFSSQLEDNDVPPILRQYGFKTALLLPVNKGKDLHVALILFSCSRSHFSPDEKHEIISAGQSLKLIILRLMRKKKMEGNQTLFRSLIRSMPSGVIVRNREGKVIHYNLVVARIFGQHNDTTLPPEVLFRGVRFFDENDNPINPAKLPGMMSLRDGQKIRNYEVRVLRNDNTSVWVSVNTEPMFYPGEKVPFAMVATLKDITINRRIRTELEKTREEAIEANKSKSAFLANISHEIRTPLSGIMGLTDILLSSDLNEEQYQSLQMMKSAEKTLLDIINKVLELSKIESGATVIERKPFELRDCISHAIGPLQMGHKNTKIEYRLDISDAVPDIVVGDEYRIQQVLMNLVSNALKFTEKGSISVIVRQYAVKNEELTLLFAVQDSGVGISKADQARIFNTFQQGDSSFSKRHQGTGLGLSISKRLIELMGGSIWLESSSGRGSTFYFSMDLGLPSDSSEETSRWSDQHVSKSTTSLDILLVEDNRLNQQAVAHYLQEIGHRTSVAANGEEALDVLRERNFDLILMDVQMPKMNGLEASQRIRQGGDVRIQKDIPIIALTAYAMKNEVEQILESGMNACVSKPIDPELLFREIENTMLSNTEDGAGNESDDTLQQNPPVQNETGDRVKFRNFEDDYRTDIKTARELLSLYIRDVPGRIAMIERGLKEGETRHLADTFHSLTNNLSAVRLYLLAGETRNMEHHALLKNFNTISDAFPDLKRELQSSLKEAQRYLTLFDRMREMRATGDSANS